MVAAPSAVSSTLRAAAASGYRVPWGRSSVKSKIVIAVVVVVLLAIGGVAAFSVWLVVREVHGDVREQSGVDKAFAVHEAELRAVPGLTGLGTYTTSSEPPYIYVEVEEITPEVRAAVPESLDGYRVVLRKEVPPTSPPLLAGEVTRVRAATAEQAAAGIAGSLVVDGDFYSKGLGYEDSEPRTLTVQVPAGVSVWRPMGEGKDFITVGEVRAGDRVQVTLTEPLAKRDRVATAADVEVY